MNIRVTFQKDTYATLTLLAKQEHTSLPSLVRHLEHREDTHFSKLADELDQEGLKTISHEDAW